MKTWIETSRQNKPDSELKSTPSGRLKTSTFLQHRCLGLKSPSANSHVDTWSKHKHAVLSDNRINGVRVACYVSWSSPSDCRRPFARVDLLNARICRFAQLLAGVCAHMLLFSRQQEDSWSDEMKKKNVDRKTNTIMRSHFSIALSTLPTNTTNFEPTVLYNFFSIFSKMTPKFVFKIICTFHIL